MTMLAHYDRAMTALSEALKSTAVDVVLKSRDELDHVKLHARKVRDQALLVDAFEFQTRVERWLGVLLQRAKEAGHLREGRSVKVPDGEIPPASLSDIGVDRKLSMKAQALAQMELDAFEAAIAAMRSRMSAGRAIVVDMMDTARQGDKKEARATRERELASKQQALPNKRYGVIYADPEWRFEVYSRDTGMDRAADNHYPTSETDAICARPVQDIAADDCVLFLWATVPMLPDALRVMAAWGFTYKSHAIWIKDRIGTGYWFRNQHELLLVGTRGDIPAPAMGTQLPSVFQCPVQRHSQKPDAAYEVIELYFPTLPRIELNARVARDGWDSWGNEVEGTGVAA